MNRPIERRTDPVEPLVAEQFLDHLAADQRRVVHQLSEHLLHLAPALRPDKTVDERAVDLRPEPDGGDQARDRVVDRTD